MKKIKEVLINLGISEIELSKKTNIKLDKIKSYLTGTHIPISDLKKISKIVGKSPAYLLGYEDEIDSKLNSSNIIVTDIHQNVQLDSKSHLDFFNYLKQNKVLAN